MILNEIVWPRSTLMSVANPWMLGSPQLLMSHSVAGLPGLQFSAMILFAGAAHGDFAAGCAVVEAAARCAGRASIDDAPIPPKMIASRPADMCRRYVVMCPPSAAGERSAQRDGDASYGHLLIRAVVCGPAHDDRSVEPGRRVPLVRPRLASDCRMPRCAAIHRHLNAADDSTAAVGGSAADFHDRSSDCRSVERRHDPGD